MPFAEILGQARAVARLRRAWAAGRLAQAYCFVGPEGVGRRTAALALAQAANCRTPASDPAGGEPDACGACPACRKIAAGTHPDVAVIGPAEKAAIDIDQVREMIARAGRRAYEGTTKVWILDPADRMQDPAANAFLKTLEEPPGAALFILLATTVGGLLPTIRSRCQAVRFDPLDEGSLAAILARHGRPAAEVGVLAALAGGSAGRALGLDLAQEREAREVVLREIWGCLPSVPAALVQAEAVAEALRKKGRGPGEGLLETLTAFCRELAVARLGPAATPLANPFWRETAQELAPGLSLGAILALQGAVAEAQRALAVNANPRLTAERMLFRMQDAIRGDQEATHAQRRTG